MTSAVRRRQHVLALLGSLQWGCASLAGPRVVCVDGQASRHDAIVVCDADERPNGICTVFFPPPECPTCSGSVTLTMPLHGKADVSVPAEVPTFHGVVQCRRGPAQPIVKEPKEAPAADRTGAGRVPD